MKKSSYRMSLHGVRLPIMPGKITIIHKGKNQVVDLINGGEMNLIKNNALKKIEFECIIPQVYYPFADYPNGFQPASYYLKKFEEMKNMKSPFKLKIIRMTQTGNGLFNTTMYVTLEEYTVTESDENGTDLLIPVKLKEYKAYAPKELKPTSVKSESGKNKVTVNNSKKRKSKTPATSYTVKEGDSLWRIAKKQLNNANKWKDIYTLNKSAIEATAKKHGRASSSNGWWIYPGTKLKLPS